MTELSSVLRPMVAKARQKLSAARRALDAGDWDDASSRAYYAAFHATCAVLRSHGLAYSSHGQTLGAFNRECVQSGEFPRETTRVLTRLFEDRQLADYEVLHSVGQEDAVRDVRDAAAFVESCVRYLEARVGEPL
jgi:hypothetical protein